jgi:hypothetical protein
MSETTYIYDKKEYKKTGREATKQEARSTRVKELVEIRPVSAKDSNEFDIWVDPKDLFEVIGKK